MNYYQFSLFRKIKPEALQSIYNYLENYPTLLESIISELKENIRVDDLSFGAANYIFKSQRSDIFDEISEHKLRELFN